VVIKTKHKFWKLSNLFIKKEAFIRKFYTNELIRGTIFFIGLGFVFSIYAFLSNIFFGSMEEPFIYFGLSLE
jgi:hypothetical protein